MKKQNINIEHSSELCNWLFNSSDLDAIINYIDFNKKTKKWHCKLLNLKFPHIFGCKECLKCLKPYKKLMSEIAIWQEDEYFGCLEDGEMYDDGLDGDEEEYG